MAMSNAPELTLKWGTVKGWSGLTTACKEALQKWADFGTSLSAMQQVDKPGQKEALCAAIDVVVEEGGKIYNDWEGEYMTPERAKKYIMEYRT